MGLWHSRKIIHGARRAATDNSQPRLKALRIRRPFLAPTLEKMLTFPQITLLIREAALSFGRDQAPRQAAAMTYFTLFALAPLLILLVAVLTTVLNDPNVQERIFSFISKTITPEVGQQLAEFVENSKFNITKGLGTGLLVAFPVLAWGATNLAVQLQLSLNDLWNVPPEATGGFLGQLKTRGQGLLMVLGFGAVIVLFFAFNTYLSAVAAQVAAGSGLGTLLTRLVTLALGIIALTGVFAVIYRVIPNVKLQWRDVTVGAAVTAILFSLLQMVIGYYFARFAPQSAFGAAGSVIALLLWIFYSYMIFFFGAELTFAYAKHFGSAEALLSARNKEDGYLSLREARAIAYAAEGGAALTPQQRRRAWERATRLDQPHSMLTLEQSAPRRVLPSVTGALWHALSAVLAVPTLLLLKLLGLGGTKRVVQKRVTVHTDKAIRTRR